MFLHNAGNRRGVRREGRSIAGVVVVDQFVRRAARLEVIEHHAVFRDHGVAELDLPPHEPRRAMSEDVAVRGDRVASGAPVQDRRSVRVIDRPARLVGRRQDFENVLRAVGSDFLEQHSVAKRAELRVEQD